MKAYGLLLTLLLIGSVGSVRSQDIEVDSTLFERHGRQYYRYIVQGGNTLYSIARKYSVSVQDINRDNPHISDGLGIGDTLYIIAVEKDARAKQLKMEVDGNYIVHEVQKGQTLYALSKMYEIEVGDIIEANPELKGGVKEGQLIRIPVARLKKQEEVQVSEERKIEEQRMHKVEAGETLYSLARRYSVSITQIREANGGLPDGLRQGQDLVIPMALSVSSTVGDSSVLKEVYKVALILPFFLDLNDTLISRLRIDEEETVLAKSNVAIQFYEGVLMAVDSLHKMGMHFELAVYDSGKDSNVVDNMLKRGELDDVDLVIGPFYQSQFMRVAEFARERKIHIVSPVPLSNRILLGNPYVSKVATSQNILFKNLGEYIQKNYGTENVIIVMKSFRANAMAHSFSTSYSDHTPADKDTTKRPIHEIRWDNGSIDGITSLLSDSAFNIILIPSNDQVYVTELLSKLNQMHQDVLFKIIGTENWLRYSNLDIDYLENLHVTIPIDAYVNYDEEGTRKFIRSFEKKFETFPENFSFLGFDVTFYFLSLMHEKGTRIEPFLSDYRKRLLYREFNFFKTGIESGYENSCLRILEHRDMEIVEIR